MARSYAVYILTNRSGSLYVGVTGNLERRLLEHRTGLFGGFSKRYRMHKLVYVEESDRIEDAIAREKEIKGWRREKKVALITSQNPMWEELAPYEEARGPSLRSG